MCIHCNNVDIYCVHVCKNLLETVNTMIDSHSGHYRARGRTDNNALYIQPELIGAGFTTERVCTVNTNRFVSCSGIFIWIGVGLGFKFVRTKIGLDFGPFIISKGSDTHENKSCSTCPRTFDV